jgi:hypothetical protein
MEKAVDRPVKNTSPGALCSRESHHKNKTIIGCHNGVPRAMCHVQNLTRKNGTYYYRRQIRFLNDKPFRLRFSLKTTDQRRACMLAPALSLICEGLAVNKAAEFAKAGLTAAQRNEIYRRQVLIERNRLEVMQADILCSEAINYIDTEQLLKVHLDGAELANRGGIVKGKVDDFLVAQVDSDNDDGDILLMAWSDLAVQLQSGSADDAACAQLAGLGLDQNAINIGIAKKTVHSARLRAVEEFQCALLNPSMNYPDVPVEGFEATAKDATVKTQPVINQAPNTIAAAIRMANNDAN